MNNLATIFKKIPATKSQVNQTAFQIREAVLNGEVDPLDFIEQVTAMEHLFKLLKDDVLIKDVVLSEAEKYGKSFTKGNSNFNIREVGVKYDYSNCNDFDYEKLKNEQSLINEKIKKREEFLKTIKTDMEVYGSDGVKLMPAIKTSSTSVVVILR